MSARENLAYRGIRAGRIKPSILALPAEVQDAMELHCARTGETLAEAALRIWADILRRGDGIGATGAQAVPRVGRAVKASNTAPAGRKSTTGRMAGRER